ncbi:MAG: 6,7-dimethyl-8-ribityllumazine synthase [Bacteroidaceae bacterium]|nr:6,7-dimethyl-8-ribityllumazine synthase [Bacteroidaceae bacterium]
MASFLHNLSDYDTHSVPDATGMRVGIVVSEWNEKITGALLEGACQTLIKHGVREEDITVKPVPGSFELVYGAARFVNSGQVDAVIAIGCVIRGDTPHFEYICQGATQGLTDLNREGKVPVIYGLLTCNTLEQAQERCGGMLGNKVDECAVTAIKMVKGWE